MLILHSFSSNPKSKIIKIAGAGIAGMSAAINIKKAGYNVVVYEKQSIVGGNRHGDYEGLDNWIFNDSMENFIISHGFNFKYLPTIPIHQFTVHMENRASFLVQSPQPFFYMVKRGSEQDSLDQHMYKQCKNVGVDFKFNTPARGDCDIDSTGPSKAAAYIKGVNFKTSLKNQVHLLLGKKFAPKGYAYLIIIDGQATLATAFKKVKNYKMDLLQNSIEYFTSKEISIPKENMFGSRGSFSMNTMRTFQRPFKIGEAGGFQDFLFGFGMRMAMRSGLAAAYQLTGEVKSAKNIMRDLNRKRKISFINRIIFEQLNNNQMEKIADLFVISDEPLELLKHAYKWNLKKILRWIRFRKRFEVRPT